MRPKAACALVFTLCLAFASAEEAQGVSWREAFMARLAAEGLTGKGRVAFSPLALRITLAAGEGRWQGLPPAEALAEALALARSTERSLRFGVSPQDAAGRARQDVAVMAREDKGGKGLARGLEKAREEVVRGGGRHKDRPVKNAGGKPGAGRVERAL